MQSFANPDVETVFNTFPANMRPKLLALRELIFQTAASIMEVGQLEEALKWGEPAYITRQSKSGSTIRINCKKTNISQYAMYFNCQTTLIESFRMQYPNDLTFEGNRAIVFNESEALPIETIKNCIAAALTYHRSKT